MPPSERTLTVTLLGAFAVSVDGQAANHFAYDKVRALLAYLAVEPAVPHRRETLLALLWPELPEHAARHNLSQALLTLRQVLHDASGPPFLLVDRNTVQRNPFASWHVDLAVFHRELAACAAHPHARPELCPACAAWRQAAVARYGGDFLKGVTVRDSAAWEEWMTVTREHAHRNALDALAALIRFHSWRGETEQALGYARRQLALEPWREETHQTVMQLLAHSGQRSAALAQYAICCRILLAEFGAEPAATTKQLYERIRTARDERPALPVQPTALVGRRDEIADLCGMLAHPYGRLLSIIGPGGVGKTRLALAVAAQVANRFVHGVCIVPLSGLESPALLMSTIAQALGVVMSGTSDPTAQLHDYLRQRELLLVLDSFEHLVAGTSLLSDVLAAAPDLKILVTSRKRLHSVWEETYDLGGLPVPSVDHAEDVERFSAAQLFIQSARRARHAFVVAPADQPAIQRICQLVEGLPLALELAAGWVRAMPCDAIASAMTRGFDLLATRAADAPHRHSSIRVVMDHSWRLLAADEQRALRGLWVFRSSFSPTAAAQVAAAPLATLARLADASLVQHQLSGRYDLHALVRQYAAERSAVLPDEHAEVLARHSAYYCGMLLGHGQALHGGDQQNALAAIANDIEDIRAACSWLLDNGSSTELLACFDALFRFYTMRGWSRDGAGLIADAVARLEATPAGTERDLLVARLRLRQAYFCTQLSELAAADTLVQQSLPVITRHGTAHDLAFAHNQRGEIAWQRGEYESAKEAFQLALPLYEAASDHGGTALAQLNLGITIHSQGRYQQAQQHYKDALCTTQAIGDRWGEAAALHRLGVAAYELGNYAEAEQHYQASMAIKRDLGDHRGRARSLNNLGVLLHDLGRYGEAQAYFEEVMALHQQLGNRSGIATASTNLGLIAAAQGDYTAAHQWYEQCHALCSATGDQRGQSIALNNLGEVSITIGDYQQALKYLQQALALCQSLGYLRGATFALHNLGDASLALEAEQDAAHYYLEALQLGWETQAPPRMLNALVGIATLLSRSREQERAVALLALVRDHPASETVTRAKAERQLQALGAQHTPEGLHTPHDLAATTQALLAEQHTLFSYMILTSFPSPG